MIKIMLFIEWSQCEYLVSHTYNLVGLDRTSRGHVMQAQEKEKKRKYRVHDDQTGMYGGKLCEGQNMMMMRRIKSRAFGEGEDVLFTAHGKWECTVLIILVESKHDDWRCEKCMCKQGERAQEKHFLSLSILTQTTSRSSVIFIHHCSAQESSIEASMSPKVETRYSFFETKDYLPSHKTPRKKLNHLFPCDFLPNDALCVKH
jgi:hypothetical protein